MDLLLLTKFYPYGIGEAFLENEIEILATYFKKILIIACEVPKSESKKRTVPDNVIVTKVEAETKTKDGIGGIAKYCFSSESVLKNEYHNCKGITQRIFLSYFEEKSQRIYKSIIRNKYLENITNDYVLYSYWLFVTARVGTLISENKRPVKMISRAHRYDLYADKNSLEYLPLRNHLLDRYDAIYPCSDNGTQYLTKNYLKYSKKIETAFLGTKDYGISQGSKDGAFRIVSCSRLNPVKRVHKIIEGLILIDNKNLNIKWHHIGDGEEFEKLKAMAAKLKNIEYVFHGDIKNKDVIKMYKTMPFDLFVNVSSSEGLPVSIMEAISFGMPVVATNVGGTSEIVFNNTTGYLIDEDFTDKILAERIMCFVNLSKVEIESFRSNCRHCWEEKFQAIPNYTKLCDNMIKEPNRE